MCGTTLLLHSYFTLKLQAALQRIRSALTGNGLEELMSSIHEADELHFSHPELNKAKVLLAKRKVINSTSSPSDGFRDS